jgi:anthranilate/para-aminobenzoate synthase component I
MMLNIAIRTMILTEQKLHIYAGGGIVADSDPDAEFEETTAKILGLRRALGATQPDPVVGTTNA